MKKPREDGYILTDRDGCITLTEKGQAVAGRIYERHWVQCFTLNAMNSPANRNSTEIPTVIRASGAIADVSAGASPHGRS